MTDVPPGPGWGVDDFLTAARYRPVRMRHQESYEIAFIERSRAIEVLRNELAKVTQRADWKTPAALGVTIAIVIPITDWSWTDKRLFFSGEVWQRVFIVVLVLTIIWLLIAATQWARWQPISPEDLYERLTGSAVSDLASGQEPHTSGLLMEPMTLPLETAKPAKLAEGGQPLPPEPQVGSRVSHPSYGEGTVRRLEVADDRLHHTTIEFDDPALGTKSLITSLSPLALVLDETTGRPAFE